MHYATAPQKRLAELDRSGNELISVEVRVRQPVRVQEADLQLSHPGGISRELNTRSHVESSAVASRAGDATNPVSLVVHFDTGARVEVQAAIHERDAVCG